MTRINVVPVEELCHKHLLAEYRELPRVFALARPCIDAPKVYVLGIGHVKFFYNKLLFLVNRQHQIYNECINRGFILTYKPYELNNTLFPTELYNDYTPTQDAINLNRARIEERKANFKRKLYVL